MNLWSYLLERPLVEELGPPARRAARHSYQQDFSVALLSAGALHFGILVTGVLLLSLMNGHVDDQRPIRNEGPTWVEIGHRFDPKSPDEPKPRKFVPQRPPKAPNAGIPIPVHMEEPDSAEVMDPEPITDRAIPGSEDSPVDGGGGDGNGNGNGSGRDNGVGNGDGDGDGDGGYPGPNEYIRVEVEPELVDMPKPEYPELAKLARIEGMVHVRVLVGRDGRVKNAILVKGAHGILDQAALAAAKLAIYKPAMQQQKPVPAWVTIPFRFSLH